MTLRFKGFTLLEILVTVAIIAIITTIAVVATQNVRLKARDTNRISNVNQVVSALEQYYARNNTYPTMIVPGEPIQAGSITYLPEAPKNPSPQTDGGCPRTDFQYQKNSSGYRLVFCLGSDNGSLKKGYNICTNGNCKHLGEATVTDSDGNVYNTVVVGSQLWMGSNLRTKTKPNGTCINGGGNPPCPEAVAFADSPRSCPPNGQIASDCSEGAMYRWSAVMNSSGDEGAQGICPSGWHVPTTADFSTLSSYLQASATSEYIRWPAGLGHRIRYHLNGISGTMLPYAATAAEAEARYNYQDPNNSIFDFPLSGFGLFGIESGDEFSGPEGESVLATSSSAGGGTINSYQTLLEVDGNGTPTGYSTPSNVTHDAREALQVRCVKNS